jgi:oligoendopeptidase F
MTMRISATRSFVACPALNVARLILILSWVVTEARAQAPLTPLQLSRTLYFPDSSAELSTRLALHARVDSLVHALTDADDTSLPQQLGVTNHALIALQRHAAFLQAQTLENTEDPRARRAYLSISGDESALTAAMATRLMRVSPNVIVELGRYAKLARDVQSSKSQRLTPDAEHYRTAVTVSAEQAIGDKYDALLESLPKVGNIAAPDIATRRAAFARRTEVFDSVAPVTATLLATLIDVENLDASAYGFRNAAQRKYASLGLSDTLVDQTLNTVAAEASAYRHYEQVIADHAANRLGVSPVFADELNVGSPPPPTLPFDQGRKLVLDAFEPLGADYVRRFAALLDPSRGRLDLSGGSHRASGGTSIVAYDAPVALYVHSYTGTLANLSVIAHEGGHAIHRELMNSDSLPVYQRSGAHFLFEGYAIFNQWLFLDHAAQAAPTPADRQQALQALLSSMAVEIFTSAEETSFEKRLYSSASGDALLDRAGIDAIYRASIAPYEYWPMTDVGTSRAWMSKDLLFEDPLYLVNYLYASFVAVALYDRGILLSRPRHRSKTT